MSSSTSGSASGGSVLMQLLGQHPRVAAAVAVAVAALLAQRANTPAATFARALPVALAVVRAASAAYDQLPAPLRPLGAAAGAAVLAYFARLAFIKDPLTYTAYLEANRAQQQRKANVPRVCVIGAGFTGLGACGALRRWNIEFDCYEEDDQVGGNWYHGVYETVHIISSRKTTEFKDYPMPETFPDFPSKDQMYAYLNDYCDHFGLREHIRLRCRVANVRLNSDGEGFIVRFADGSEKFYGAVIVATGHHWDKRFAGPYPGQDQYTGEVLHSKEYKVPSVLQNKRVLTIGGGNSACDISVEAARFARESHLSVRRGYWFMPRSVAGIPAVELLNPFFPLWLQRIALPVLLRVIVGTYSQYGLPEPDHKIWEHHPTINSELLQFIKLGEIKPHPDIRRFCGGKTVEFVDGTKHDFDLIVHATGYHVSFPIVADGIIEWSEPRPDGYRYPNLLEGLIPVNVKNLFIFGVGQPRYGAGPLITAGAESIAGLLKAQADMKYPVGRTLKRLGLKPPTSYLQDPVQVFNAATAPVGLLPLAERVMIFAGLLRERDERTGAVADRFKPLAYSQ